MFKLLKFETADLKDVPLKNLRMIVTSFCNFFTGAVATLTKKGIIYEFSLGKKKFSAAWAGSIFNYHFSWYTWQI